VVLPHYPVILCVESCLLVSWCAGDMCDMTGSDDDCDRSRRPGTEDLGWSSIDRVIGGRIIKRSGDAVCGLHRAQGDEERGFIGLASKPRSMVSPGLASKPVASGFQVWASKLAASIW
jgi:hypothetical protein